jgi:hypothetical protein
MMRAFTGESRGHMLRSRWAAIGAAVAVTFGAGGLAAVNAAGGVDSTTVLTDPVRVLDSRDPVNVGLNGPFASQVPQKLKITGSISTTTGTKTVVPTGATGVLLNVTAVAPSAAGFISIRPGDATGLPSTSSLNFTAGQIVPNAVLVALPTGGANAGQIDITYDAFGAAGPTTDILIDVVGYTNNSTLAALQAKIDTKANSADVYTKAQVDGALVAERLETVTAGGADGAFVFPVAQLTMGTRTITTTKAGHLQLEFIGYGGMRCLTASDYVGWLEVDGVPVRSSKVSIGENFAVTGAEDFSAVNFPQKVLQGVTAAPVAAGSHEIRARFACRSGASNTEATGFDHSWVVTVLSGTTTVAALEQDVPDDSSMTGTMCITDAAGTETCTSE